MTIETPPPTKTLITPSRIAFLSLAAAAPILLLVVIWQLRVVVLLLFAASLIAIVLDGFARWQGRFVPFSHGVRLAIAAVLLLAIGGGIGFMFGQEIERQVSDLLRLLPGGWDDMKNWLGEERVNAVAERLAPSGNSIFTILQTFVGIISSALSGLFLALIGGIFLAAQPRTYRHGLVMMMPKRWEARAIEVFQTLGDALRAWLGGQLVSMVFVGTTIFAGLTVIGAPSPLALALIAAILGFIPVIGPLLAAIPAVLVGLTMGASALPWIILLYFVVQNFDGNILNPLVMRHVVKIPPAVTMFALFAIGALMGPVGMLLRGPITVFFFVMTRELWVVDTLDRSLEEG